MSNCRSTAGLALIKDQFVFAVGGVDELSSRSVEMLDLYSQSPIWVPMVDMLVSRTDLGVAALDECIYAVSYTNIFLFLCYKKYIILNARLADMMVKSI